MARQIHGAHEPLMHISKREECSFLRAALVRLAAVVLGLVVCAGVIVALTGLNPIQVYASIIDGAVGSNRRLWVTLRDALTLLLVAVALTPAFKMRFWNVGGEGQILVGAAAAAAVMIYLGRWLPERLPAWLASWVPSVLGCSEASVLGFGASLSTVALLIAMALAAMLAGTVWGLIPALFKAGWNTNETLFTLMMNYIATQLVLFCVVFWENPPGSNTVGLINPDTQAGWMPELFGLKYGWSLVIVVIIAAFMYVYLRYSKQGYEIAYVGQSVNTARYAGISVRKVIIRTMAISGALCGLAGFLLVSNTSHTVSEALAGGRGFTAIVVAWLSKLNTFTMMAVSFLLTFMGKGALQIASQFNLNENASEIITGIILFFVLGCEFFIHYKISFRHRKED